MSTRRGERGQTLLLSALLVVVLIGFVGLVVDGGEAASEQQMVRNAADGAALAGAYSILRGSTIAAATTLAGQVLTADSLPAGDLTMTYLDSGGSVTAVAANVRKVRAVVTDQHRTYFLGALGVNNVQLTATAEATTGSSSAAASCALCVMAAANPSFGQGNNSTVTIAGGPMIVNSTDSSAIFLGNNAALTAPSITIATGGSYSLGSGATITPTPTNAAPIADPLLAIPYPSLGGVATAYTAPPGISGISPGVYSSITVGSGRTVNMGAGTYVVTGSISISGILLGTAGVTVFLACPSYPTACTAGSFGAQFSVTGTMTLSPPTSGSYAGLTVFADRNNQAINTASQATWTVSGTWYTPMESFVDLHTGDTDNFGQMIVLAAGIVNNSTLNVTKVAASSYGGAGSGSLGLSL
jgi:hypothetical protein